MRSSLNFCRWLLGLLGALPGDSLDDPVPWLGIVTWAGSAGPAWPTRNSCPHSRLLVRLWLVCRKPPESGSVGS